MEPDGQAKMRADLRVKYMEAASQLIQALDSPQAKHAYLTHELTNLGVSLGSFDPDDQDFLHSKACLFQPLSSEAFGEYSLRESDVEETGWGAISYYMKFDEIYDRPVVDVEHLKESLPNSYIVAARAEQIFEHLNILCAHYKKKVKKNLVFFDEATGWDEIRHGSSFLDGPRGLLLGLRPGFPDWDVRAERQWQKNYDDLETICPHVMLIICTGVEAQDGELLFGELGPIVQAIQNRLSQKEFEKTSLFPVLAVSFFGPRHARLLQAKFDKSGILEVRASPIYSFRYRNQALSKLFLRYYACEPQDGPEYEFYSEPEDDSEQESDDDKEDMPSPGRKYVSPHPGSDKENLCPT